MDRATVKRLVQVTNKARADAGLRPVRLDRTLEVASTNHACTMVQKGVFGHTGYDGSSPMDRALRAGMRNCRASENIAMRQRTGAEVLTGWLGSPGHRRNIMDPSAVIVGFGAAGRGTPDGIRWVMMLAACP